MDRYATSGLQQPMSLGEMAEQRRIAALCAPDDEAKEWEALKAEIVRDLASGLAMMNPWEVRLRNRLANAIAALDYQP